jgi:hypothetical protein
MMGGGDAVSPDEFSFTLTVSGSEFEALVRELTMHTAGYARVAAPGAAALADRVIASLQRQGRPSSRLQFSCGGGRLIVTVNDDPIEQPV